MEETLRAPLSGLPICVVGMHRSGTSMVTRLLNLCGMYLGPEEELLAKDANNPEGYWEHARFVELNDRLLSRSGAAWDYPARLSPDAAGPAEMERARASSLLSQLATQGAWGWKDPRTSLTLPFWKSLLPNLRAVVCVRNPLEVAHSLAKRNQHSPELALNLWHEYNLRILEEVPPEQRVVTHYDAYFTDPIGELRRVVKALGLPTLDSVVASAAATVGKMHRHHRFTADHVAEASVTFEVHDTYLALCEEAGWDDSARAPWRREARPASATTSRTSSLPRSTENIPRFNLTALELAAAKASLREWEGRRQQWEAELAQKQHVVEAITEEHRRELAHREAALQAVRAELEAARRQLQELGQREAELQLSLRREGEIQAALRVEVDDAHRQADELAQTLSVEQEEWNRIRSGAAWPVLEGVWKWRARLLPHHSLRDDAVQGALRLGRGLKSRLGPKG